jgi:hypothetical protein
MSPRHSLSGRLPGCSPLRRPLDRDVDSNPGRRQRQLHIPDDAPIPTYGLTNHILHV